jgi:hypothetical protein
MNELHRNLIMIWDFRKNMFQADLKTSIFLSASLTEQKFFCGIPRKVQKKLKFRYLDRKMDFPLF